MYLTSLIQRDRLFQLASRWFAGQVEPQDGHFLTEVFIYEQPIIAPIMLQIMREIYQEIYPGLVHVRRVTSKDELRQAIIDSSPEPDDRAAHLFQHFQMFPEEYFPHTPVDLILASTESGALIGMTRFKSIRRIADKASRRIIDRLAGEIRSTARSLSELRAREAGIPLDQLASSSELMAHDFIRAEQIVSRSFETADILLTPKDIHIDDVVGFKFIGSVSQLETIQEAIVQHPKIRIAELELHLGDYKDTNLLIDFQLPPAGIIIDRLRERDWSHVVCRGLDPAVVQQDLPEYVENGARSIRAEVILTTFEELVESEFGRSIHEERIIRQRNNLSYSGRIAQNASYLIEYMLMLALSPRVEVGDLPIKMWGRYLPEMVNSIIWNLFNFDPLVNPVFDIQGLLATTSGEGVLWA